jgi:hypothetical protein
VRMRCRKGQAGHRVGAPTSHPPRPRRDGLCGCRHRRHRPCQELLHGIRAVFPFGGAAARRQARVHARAVADREPDRRRSRPPSQPPSTRSAGRGAGRRQGRKSTIYK